MMDTSNDEFVHQAEALTDIRRERLWLGYSGENLHRYSQRQYIGQEMEDIDDRGAENTIADQKRPAESDGIRQRNLEKQAQGSSSAIGDSGDDEERYNELDELAAPPPIDEEAQRRGSHLEDRRDGTLTPKEEADGTHELAPQGSRVSRAATELYTICYLIAFSFFGTLARLGVQALTLYPGAPVQTGLLWANVSGSFIMGFLLEDRMLFREEWGVQPSSASESFRNTNLMRTASRAEKHNAVKKTLPLYIGLATGFCGSFTSFSAFIRDSFYALANALPVPINHPSAATPPSPISQTLNVHRNGGYSFMALLAVLLTTLGLSLGALQIGAQLALAIEPWTPAIPFAFARRIVDRLFVFVALGLWVAAIIMSITPPDRPGGTLGKPSRSGETWRSKALFALVFAPLGCLLRFYVSLHLNGRIKSFPLGTFVVNILGTVMEAAFLDLQHAPIGGIVGCQLLQGMNDGFCGCLTTVSTWVAEIKGLRLKHAYTYASASIAVGLLAFVIITGSFMWTHGFKPILCVT